MAQCRTATEGGWQPQSDSTQVTAVLAGVFFHLVGDSCKRIEPICSILGAVESPPISFDR